MKTRTCEVFEIHVHPFLRRIKNPDACHVPYRVRGPGLEYPNLSHIISVGYNRFQRSREFQSQISFFYFYFVFHAKLTISVKKVTILFSWGLLDIDIERQA